MTMNWFDCFKKPLAAAFLDAKHEIAGFPSPLNSIGLSYADKFDPLAPGGGKDYICVLLPYWMKEAVQLTDRQCRSLVLANIYGMLYFFIQDDAMDDGRSVSKEQLALANLLHLKMLSALRELFPSESPFWPYFESYVATWADSVVNENKLDYFNTNRMMTAGKAAPVKIASTGACLLAGRKERISAYENAVDIALMTLQMLDDWSDWKEDLENGSYNGLLAMIAKERSETAGIPIAISDLKKPDVETSLFVLGIMDRYAAIAHRSHQTLLELPFLSSHLADYHSYMAGSIADMAQNIRLNKQKRLGGGINFLQKLR
ncbi:hypothetical protein ACFQZE_12965 [Paenibacillus sp. GCM10027627]|uniref:hypothetical protein n=1 Tax=unclassified Paenibacillus TaxID=185978 RepID=UPI00362B4073